MERSNTVESKGFEYDVQGAIEKRARTSIVRNFEESTTLDELAEEFGKFGLVNKVTLTCNHITGKPKNVAYIEFEEEKSRNKSLELNGTLFKNNVIYVNKLTKEIPLSTGRREKCYNIDMEGYFEGAKDNIGPIRIRKKIKKKKFPY